MLSALLIAAAIAMPAHRIDDTPSPPDVAPTITVPADAAFTVSYRADASAAHATSPEDALREAGHTVSDQGYVTPVEGARLTSSYGMRTHPITGAYVLHNGADLAAASGTPIYAAREGTVIAASYSGYTPLGMSGYVVVVQHADGVVTAYGHMARIDVSVGQSVAAGDVLGAVGSTGNSTGPHLHFVVQIDGQTVDPLTVIDL